MMKRTARPLQSADDREQGFNTSVPFSTHSNPPGRHDARTVSSCTHSKRHSSFRSASDPHDFTQVAIRFDAVEEEGREGAKRERVAPIRKCTRYDSPILVRRVDETWRPRDRPVEVRRLDHA